MLKEYATIYEYGEFTNGQAITAALITHVKDGDWYVLQNGGYVRVAYKGVTSNEAIQCAIAKMLPFLNEDWEPGMDKWTFKEN